VKLYYSILDRYQQETLIKMDVFCAAMIGDDAEIRRFIDSGGDVNSIDDEDGGTPLFAAAFWSHFAVASLLIESGCDLDRQRNDGMSALMVACRNDQPNLVKLLLDAGANISLSDELGNTALHWAHSNKAVECIELLMQGGADPTLVNSAGEQAQDIHGNGVGGGEGDANKDAGHDGGGMESGSEDSDCGASGLSDFQQEESKQKVDSRYLPSARLKVLPVRSNAGWELQTSIVGKSEDSFPWGTNVTLIARGSSTTSAGGLVISPKLTTFVWTGPTINLVLLCELHGKGHDAPVDECVSLELYVGLVCICSLEVDLSKGDVEEESKLFSAIFLCLHDDDRPLIEPSLRALTDVHGIQVLTRAEKNGETEARIRDAESFQMCWSHKCADDSVMVTLEIDFAKRLLQNRLLTVRGVFWEPGLPHLLALDDAVNVKLQFLGNSLTASESLPRNNVPAEAVAAGNGAEEDSPAVAGASNQMSFKTYEEPVDLVTAGALVENLMRAISRAGVDLPCLPWLSPDTSAPTPLSPTSKSWLSGPVRIQFVCPQSWKAGCCRGFHVRLPQGWQRELTAVLLEVVKVLRYSLREGSHLHNLLLPVKSSSRNSKFAPPPSILGREDECMLEMAEKELKLVANFESDEQEDMLVSGFTFLAGFVKSYDGLLGSCGLQRLEDREEPMWVLLLDEAVAPAPAEEEQQQQGGQVHEQEEQEESAEELHHQQEDEEEAKHVKEERGPREEGGQLVAVASERIPMIGG
jgi:hypothetical protein